MINNSSNSSVLAEAHKKNCQFSAIIWQRFYKVNIELKTQFHTMPKKHIELKKRKNK